MNIFILDKNPIQAAKDQCDKHVCKMILESAQMLCLALPSRISPYKQAYQNHPCSKWALRSKANYNWLLDHAFALSHEYTLRYKKIHKCQEVLGLILQNMNNLAFGEDDLTSFAQAMPDQYKDPTNAVKAYRAYYKGEKRRFAKWKNGREEPDWW